MTDVVQLQTTHDDRAALDALITGLVDDRLIACGQIVGPIASTFFWQGRREHAEEYLALLKTTRALSERVVARIAAEHPYEVADIVVCEIAGGSQTYLDWVRDTVAD